MKKIFRLLPLLFLVQLNSFAQDDKDDNKSESKKKYDYIKKKSVNKSYNVSSSDKLSIENSFGSVEVKTWDRNEIKVDVDIEVSANTDALAQKIIDKISIDEGRSGGNITFKTEMSDRHNKNEKGSRDEKSTMHINYTISMPGGNPLKIENSFGSTTVPDFKGEVDLTSKFGKLTTGNLVNIKAINVEFGKADLANITSAPVNIKFSKATIGKLNGAIKMNLEFCSSIRLNLDVNLSSLELNTSYSTVNLKPVGDLQASYSIITSFGSFKNTTNMKFSSDDDKNDNKYHTNFDREYSGKSGSGNIPVRVKSSFGKIIVGEASEEDMKKDKNKDKDKSRT